jgi:hypothetical protein
METAASLATVHGKAIAFPKIAGCLVPKIKHNAVFVCGPAFFEEDLAACGISAREN